MSWLNRLPMWMLVASWVAIGTALPAFSGWVKGVRDPQDVLIHDESSYLLQADTFARGRLTNRSPRHAEFFESPYLLLVPSYQAKYPPAQAVILAIGQRFGGEPIWGVWLSCGLFAGALYWMLAGWTNRQWSALGTEYAVFALGITHYWATTYWGGMVAACGGALVLGGARWTIRKWTVQRGLLTGLGMVILANSRPYEGSVVSLACLTALLSWLLQGPRRERLRKAIGWGAPFLLVIASGGLATGLYNRAVTGSWQTLPAALHPKQYMTCGLFRWQPINQIPERQLKTRVGQVYEKDPLLNPGHPGGPELGTRGAEGAARRAFLDLFCNFISPTSLLPGSRFESSFADRYWLLFVFLATTAWFLCTTKRWGLLQAAWSLVIVEMLAGSAVWWNLVHYQAPVVCVCYFLAVDWLRRVSLACRRTRPLRILRPRYMIPFFMLAVPGVILEVRIERAVSDFWVPPAETVADARPLPKPASALTRPQLLAFLGSQKRPVLAVVSYDSGVSLHQEWVYNSADLESQRVILAHDLGPEKLPLLVADFPGRDVWGVRVTPAGATVKRIIPQVNESRQ